MNDATWVAVVTLICGMFVNIATSILAYLKAKDGLAKGVEGLAKGRENEVAIQQIHIVVNSRLSELLATAKELAHAEGVASGTASEAERGAAEARRVIEAALVAIPDDLERVKAALANTKALEANTMATDHNTDAKG